MDEDANAQVDLDRPEVTEAASLYAELCLTVFIDRGDQAAPDAEPVLGIGELRPDLPGESVASH